VLPTGTGKTIVEGVSDLLIWYPLLREECYQFYLEVP
jgi:hypothetical protein